ncbi:MAG: glycosyltransferase family 9 protein [Deltaproteobacteria bacterium]|nr:glycosyltransferase family 9 protein [Deltaproteobacteria bacterium]
MINAMDLNGKKILIIKLRYIGDTLSIIPVVENLKRNAAHAEVDVMVHKGTEDVLAFHPDIRKIWVYDRIKAQKKIVSTICYHKSFIKNMRYEKYDFVIDFTHGDRAAFLSFMIGAPQRITYRDSSTLSRILMNRIIDSDPFKHHIVDHQLESLRYFGMDTFKREMTVHIPESSELHIDHLLSTAGIGHDSLNVAIHPGARGKLRQWKPERFAEIARRLRDVYKANIILIGGAKEGDLVDAVEREMGFPASFGSTELSLLEMAALLRRCSLFLGNDSAPGHIAAAVKCPSLTLFGPTFPHMWRPLDPVGEVVFKDVPCCGCKQKICTRPDNSCMDLIEADEVWNKVERLISL